MPSQTNEAALESAIERALTGSSREEAIVQNAAREPKVGYGNGYYAGAPQDFDATYALDTVRFWHFLESSQSEELAKIQRHADWKLRILNRYDRMVKKYGILRLLRRGLDLDDAHFTLFYQLPTGSSGETVRRRSEQNEFSITRQVAYHLDNPREEIDMVVFVNGIPLATLELKNAWTGQTARRQGIKQYQHDRDPRQPLLQFARCVVHFAVDTDEVYMCTKLTGKNSFFLPFNRGHAHGAGNPPNPLGHRTEYLWGQVFTPASWANLLQHFVLLSGKAKDPLAKRTLFFPRYHQMDVVRQIINHATHKGVGHTYLIQHSAGSGKSNSITWAAYQLIETYPARADVPGAKAADQPLFDSVIVVTDRRLLDKQLRENIADFSQVKNIVAPAHSSAQLREHLEAGKKIIITTIQKFPFIVEGIADLSDRRFAVLIDEAHSSQSGTAADNMNRVMGSAETEEPDPTDAQDRIVRAMQARKMRPNASYLAFTATPKNVTLERFGVRQPPGSEPAFRPFHLYSMKQAIEEGFILDVLANYTTYHSYYEIAKSVEDNPHYDPKRAQKRLRAYVERDPRTIATKAEIMVDHFIKKVVGPKKLRGKAKAMVITQNIEAAIRYFQTIRRLLEERSARFRVLVAFSGKKTVDGVEYTEADLNGFPDKDTRDRFDTDEYRILVVANKYLTGFDQPKLCTMYVDKKLQGVLAVQALSRLNRAANQLGKKTEDLFVLDFFNSVQDIQTAFEPFYTATTLSKPTDVNVLHDLRAALDEAGVYEQTEVETFVERYFSNVDADQLSPLVDVAADRFNRELDWDDDEKVDFKVKAKQFVKIYGQMASILPYEVLAWEKLFWFLKFLIPKLLVTPPNQDALDDLLDSVDLSTYGLERTKLNHAITLDDAESTLDPQNANPRGAHGTDEGRDPLDDIIRSFNERWYEGWDAIPENRQVKLLSLRNNIRQHPDFKTKYADNPDEQNSELAFQQILREVMNQQRRQELELYKRFTKDPAFRRAFSDTMQRMVAVE